MVQGGVLFLDSNATYNFVAYALNGRLEGLAIEEPEEKYGVGNIYVGQVKRSLPSQNAAFIALDTEQSAYLDDAMALSDGDFVAVQVTRSTHNGKHARVSRNIRLYRQGISLTIQGPDSGTCSRVETLQSNQIFELINATPSDIAAAIAGQNTISSIDFHCVTRNLNYKLNTETLLSHAQELQRIVRDILECVRLCHKPQLYQQEHLVAEIISQWGIKRGYTNTFIAEDTVRIPRVIYASESAALLVKKLASEWQHLVSPLRSSTLDDHDMLQQISALTDRHVPLPEGGSCIVETTEAMVVIDGQWNMPVRECRNLL
jgi:Rne/Rng family ribonuclease